MRIQMICFHKPQLSLVKTDHALFPADGQYKSIYIYTYTIMLYLIYFVVDSYHKIHHRVICLANFLCHFSGGIFELEAWQTRQVRQYWTVP